MNKFILFILLFINNTLLDASTGSLAGTWNSIPGSVIRYNNTTCTGEGSGGYWTTFNQSMECTSTDCGSTTSFGCSDCDGISDAPCCSHNLDGYSKTETVYNCEIINYTQEGSNVIFTKDSFCTDCVSLTQEACEAVPPPCIQASDDFVLSEDGGVCEWQEGLNGAGTVTGNTFVVNITEDEECMTLTFTK